MSAAGPRRRPRETAQDRPGEAKGGPSVVPAVPTPGSRHGPPRAVYGDEAFLGIDPGLSGAFAFLHRDGGVFAGPAPLAPASRDLDRGGMLRALRSWPVVFCAIEKVDAAPMHGRRQGTTSMWRFGQGYGLWLGMLEALSIPFVEVPPRAWKKAILKGLGTDKAAAIDYCRRFYPSVDLRATPRCRTPSDGLADALCLAEYARRVWTERQLVAAAGPRPANNPEG